MNNEKSMRCKYYAAAIKSCEGEPYRLGTKWMNENRRPRQIKDLKELQLQFIKHIGPNLNSLEWKNHSSFF
jgi:hypothetical protein